MARRCHKCNGTGREFCPVHGSHPCSACGGKGCVGGSGITPMFIDKFAHKCIHGIKEVK